MTAKLIFTVTEINGKLEAQLATDVEQGTQAERVMINVSFEKFDEITEEIAKEAKEFLHVSQLLYELGAVDENGKLARKYHDS